MTPFTDLIPPIGYMPVGLREMKVVNMSAIRSLKTEEPAIDFDWRFAGEPEAWMGLRSARTFAPRPDRREGDGTTASLAAALLRLWRVAPRS